MTDSTVKSRINREKRIVAIMIQLYCRRKEGNKELCESCKELLNYANSRLNHCPFEEHKSSCKKCLIHCYKPEMRYRMKNVMRFSGPLMIIYHPVIFFKHYLLKTKY